MNIQFIFNNITKIGKFLIVVYKHKHNRIQKQNL